MQQVETPKPSQPKPNEQGTIHVTDFLRISDAKTQEVILEKRS